MSDSLGDRMKCQYERRTQAELPRRTYTILRIDGRAFHTYTRGFVKPFDHRLDIAMNATALAVCEDAMGAQFAYIQSDEISVLLTDFATEGTQSWFDGNVQKIVSVAASVATMAFNQAASSQSLGNNAVFDCRVFTIPDPTEVQNYFIWRQKDAARNSIQGLAQSHFSHKRLQGLNCSQLQELLFQEKGVNWNDLPANHKRGRSAIRGGGWRIDNNNPEFTVDRAYIPVPAYP